MSVAYSTVHQTLSFDDDVSTFSFKKSVTVNVRACLIIKGSASATSMATATLLTIRSLMMLVVYVLNEFKADIYIICLRWPRKVPRFPLRPWAQGQPLERQC